jgi:hypothetical protein
MKATCFESEVLSNIGMVYCVLHAEITIRGSYKKLRYKISELFKYVDMNVKPSS